ncbi:hypothetical protein [Acinetobacter pittii]|nr:hypothetical protein [Acinetobacter pittii]
MMSLENEKNEKKEKKPLDDYIVVNKKLYILGRVKLEVRHKPPN